MQGAGDDPPLGFQLQAASSQPVQPGLLEDSPGGGSEGQRQDSQVVGSRTTVSFFLLLVFLLLLFVWFWVLLLLLLLLVLFCFGFLFLFFCVLCGGSLQRSCVVPAVLPGDSLPALP